MSVTDFLKYVVPPHNSEGVTPWRWAIFICVILLVGDSVSSRGFLGGYGAHAAQQDVRMILELQLAQIIRDLHLQVCSIRPARNPTLDNALEDYQRRYSELTGKRYPLQRCEIING